MQFCILKFFGASPSETLQNGPPKSQFFERFKLERQFLLHYVRDKYLVDM